MFTFDTNVVIKNSTDTVPVKNILNIFRRDLLNTCSGKALNSSLELIVDDTLPLEGYRVHVTSDKAYVFASDDLGFIYALLFISKEFLGVKPFWFWMNQRFIQKAYIEIPEGDYFSPEKKVKYRGWFFNDEVLMLKWKLNEGSDEGWRMCFETLLRLGGNMAIPGTDKTSVKNRALASEYGLWITHHHAEPLGAEMFIRKYPDLEPDFFLHKELFLSLWEEAVFAQKDYKVIWNLCFRGQGDCPFWSYDKEGKYDTDEKKGKVISDLIKLQADIVKKHVANPVFCTNLYGEIMELYEAGHITFPENVILVRADNGFGKMVTRRRGNHNPRVNAMPDINEKSKQGIYYHVSFYDLQAANHITMFPNSVSFLNSELDSVLQNNGNEFWIINCSNVLPHTYFLDAVSKKWCGLAVSDESQAVDFAKEYFEDSLAIAECYKDFPLITIAYGNASDEHAGEQFYTENVRYFAHYILLGAKGKVDELSWFSNKASLFEQLQDFKRTCESKLEVQEKFLKRCEAFPDSTILLQARMHYYGAKGCVLFSDAYDKLLSASYAEAFMLLGDSAKCFEYVNTKMREWEKYPFENFYYNDAQADYKFSAYMIKKLMSYVRELGDNPAHFSWQHEYCYEKEDRGVHLLLLTDNHCTDEELYEAMNAKRQAIN